MNATIYDLPEIRFLTSGDVTNDQREATERALRVALSGAQTSVKSVRATLSVIADPSLPRPALAQAVVELDGRRLRAQAAARDLSEAIDLLQDRLAVRAAHVRAS